MSLVDRVGPVTGINFAMGSYEKFQPRFRDEKRPKIKIKITDKFWSQILEIEQTWWNTKILTFRLIIASFTLKAVSLQLNEMLMMWKLQQAMQDNAIRTTRIYPAVYPGNRDEVFIWQNFQPAYRGLGWKNRDLGNRASPPFHMNTSKILRRI